MTIFDYLKPKEEELERAYKNEQDPKKKKVLRKKLLDAYDYRNAIHYKEISMDLNAYLIGFDEREEYYDKGYYPYDGKKKKLMSDKKYNKIMEEASRDAGVQLIKEIDQEDLDEREWLLKEYQKDYPNNPEKVAEMMAFHEKRMEERRKQLPHLMLMEEDRKADEKFFQSLTEEQLDEYYQSMCEDDEVDTSKFASVEKIDIKSKV